MNGTRQKIKNKTKVIRMRRERERERRAYIVRDDTRSFVETKLVHNPVRFLSVRCPPSIKHKRLTHAYDMTLRVDRLVPPCGFPKSGCGGSVCAVSSRIFLVLVAEEVPVALILGCVVANSAHL